MIIRITLKGPDDRTAEARALRHVLKRLLRNYGLKCLRIEVLEGDDDDEGSSGRV